MKEIVKKVFYLGLDPGISGGIARITAEGEIDGLWVIPVHGKSGDKKLIDLPALRRIFEENAEAKFAVLEQVGARPGQGVSSMFKFGRCYGILEAFLVAAEIPYTLVSPAKWAGVMHSGIEKSIDPKRRSAIACDRLFPKVDFRATPKHRVRHDGLVDAAMLAEYCRRTFQTEGAK